MSKAAAVAGKTNVVLLPISDLKMRYDVRRGLNEDRVLLFMELYESGQVIPPIEVVRGTMDVHDGRHRKAALDQLGRKHAECILVEPMETLDQLMDAYGKNMSGSPYPPTRADTVFVMKQLLEAGVSNAEIQRRFQVYYMPSHVKKLLKDAHSHVSKAKLSAARSAVTHGNQTLKVAAERYGVDPESLKEVLSGAKKRRKSTSVTDILADIKSRHKSNYHSDKKVFKDILEKYEDGDISEEGVLEVLLHMQDIHKKSTKRVDEWLQRFEVLKGTLKATVK